MKTLGMTAVFILILNFSVLGQDRTARVDYRETAQRARIMEGRHSGEITHREAAHLNRQQHRIHRTEHRAKADGRVSRIERRRLHHEQNRANRSIRRAKHNSVN